MSIVAACIVWRFSTSTNEPARKGRVEIPFLRRLRSDYIVLKARFVVRGRKEKRAQSSALAVDDVRFTSRSLAPVRKIRINSNTKEAVRYAHLRGLPTARTRTLGESEDARTHLRHAIDSPVWLADRCSSIDFLNGSNRRTLKGRLSVSARVSRAAAAGGSSLPELSWRNRPERREWVPKNEASQGNGATAQHRSLPSAPSPSPLPQPQA